MKVKKFERVETYLNKLMKQKNQSTDYLSQLTYKDLMIVPELEGIGERTIANTLNAFKQDYGIKNVKRTRTKRKKVEDYFTGLIEDGQMSIELLMEKRYNDFQDVEELQGIGKTTITCALSDFKKEHASHHFEESILNYIESKNEDEVNSQTISANHISKQSLKPLMKNLDKSEFEILKEMIADYKQNSGKEKQALKELQLALRFVGIDSQTLMKQYWNSKKNGLIPTMDFRPAITGNKRQFIYDTP